MVILRVSQPLDCAQRVGLTVVLGFFVCQPELKPNEIIDDENINKSLIELRKPGSMLIENKKLKTIRPPVLRQTQC
jgi:hypothetical protein